MDRMLPILIIKTGGTFPETREKFGDFEDWTLHYAGLSQDQVMIVDFREDVPLPEMGTFSGAIMTGSHSMVTDPDPWILRTEAFIRRIIEENVPFLGVCFGHQLLGRAAGGKAGNNPKGKEVGTKEIFGTAETASDLLFQDMPPKYFGHATHTQAILDLPEGAVLLAYNNFEPHHAIRVGERAWGLQFHPEFSTEHMHEYIDFQAEALKKQGEDIAALHAQTRETGPSHGLLKRFVKVAAGEI
ncbi:GMP synthase (glutamine-hydrolysing) [Desulfatibacillum alkenivorans DSM 16219]|uniref:GMP synthase (Glutamine-hydrolysing) n=1 Tax=Desulfatibacillum alkenivorans DSM 16219 TaxID=1121393 RepID=A0A1M6RFX2_9BACT|nr:glutamine amidotransferase [Desulfatibacillum alkenivorans]SHK31359.1 GMP synthase (glutamine-hydrolysing) [Desulfatibacillum alkenivorans DSM 16219]